MKFLSSSECFDDTQISLSAEYGHKNDGQVCILGGWQLASHLNIQSLKKKYNKIIVFNQEQLGNKTTNFVNEEYFALIKQADEVWDYDENNIKILSRVRPDTKLKILKPTNKLNAGSSANKDIDVLFYGSINDRRSHILQTLKELGLCVVIPEMIFGNDLNPYIARSKICLNIHFYADTALQEQARMIRWVSSNANIISETSRHNYLGVNEVPYNYIIHECLHQLHFFN